MRMTRWSGGAANVLAVALLSVGASGALRPQSDAERAIKSKNAAERVAAVAELKAAGGDKAEKALVGALADRDWEVLECASRALGELTAKSGASALARLAIDAPAARIRRASAIALGAIDAQKAGEELGKQTAGKNAQRAWEALAYVAAAKDWSGSEALLKNLRKSQKAKEVPEQVAAAGAIHALPAAEMATVLGEYLAGDNVQFAAAALNALTARPIAEAAPALRQALEKVKLDDVLERRLIGASSALASAGHAAAVTTLLEALAGNADKAVASRAMRLAAALASSEPAPARDAAHAALARGLESSHPDVRAAALHGAVRAGHDAVLTNARSVAAKDADPRVRLIALRSALAKASVADAELLALALDRLKSDSSSLVREEAAVALAKASTPEALAALQAAAADKDWAVAVCAIISLGKTTQEAALPALVKLARESDWRLRGAAVVGLCHVTKKEAIPQIIAALGDAEPAIARSAYNYLRALSRKDLPLEAGPWQAWWKENEQRLRMWTPQEIKERREKYGYSQSIYEVFRDLDVIVLDSRGDHIQTVLDKVKGDERNAPVKEGDDGPARAIAYRMTTAGRHKADGLHPHAVYVSNCTGEVSPEDLERIAWFVRTGGYLFGSCWSLHETIERIYPGVVRKFESGGEVLDTVEAEPCAARSSYLEGVFEGGVEPVYNLEGAHLIEVLDRERCEILVDSPQCAQKWGIGNLAVWFRAGHGLVLDSVNHFDNQGFINATWIKETEERQAFAVDHMGLSYADLRATAGEKWWGGNTKAAEKIYDRTALKLVTNIVRSKRLEEP